MNLPSKKLFFIAMPLIVILGVFVMISNNSPTSKNGPKNVVSPEVVAIKNSIINEVDTDKDGLKDWEETIWKTDPNNPRTHSEYENDSAYVSAQLALIKNNTGGSTGLEPIKNTSDLGRQLFNEYLLLKESGDVTPDDIARLTDRIRQNISVPDTPEIYKASDLKTFPSSDSAKMQAYATSLKDIVNKYASIYSSQAQELSTTDRIGFDETMEFGADSYLQLSKNIMSMEVPEEIANIHVQYANSLNGSAKGLLMMLDKSDPLKSITGIQKHLSSQDLQRSSSSEISIFLSQSGIISFNLPFL